DRAGDSRDGFLIFLTQGTILACAYWKTLSAEGLRGIEVSMKMFSLLWVMAIVIAPVNLVTAGERQFLRGHVPVGVTNSTSTGRMSASKRVNLAIGLPLRNQAGLNELLREIYDPASSRYHQYLTPEQFAEMFGPSKEDYQAVIQFAETNGFT